MKKTTSSASVLKYSTDFGGTAIGFGLGYQEGSYGFSVPTTAGTVGIFGRRGNLWCFRFRPTSPVASALASTTRTSMPDISGSGGATTAVTLTGASLEWESLRDRPCLLDGRAPR